MSAGALVRDGRAAILVVVAVLPFGAVGLTEPLLTVNRHATPSAYFEVAFSSATSAPIKPVRRTAAVPARGAATVARDDTNAD